MFKEHNIIGVEFFIVIAHLQDSKQLFQKAGARPVSRAPFLLWGGTVLFLSTVIPGDDCPVDRMAFDMGIEESFPTVFYLSVAWVGSSKPLDDCLAVGEHYSLDNESSSAHTTFIFLSVEGKASHTLWSPWLSEFLLRP